MKRTDTYLAVVNICSLLALVLCYIVPSINTDFSWILATLAVIFPLLVGVNMLFVGYWLFRRAWLKLILGIVVLFSGWPFLQRTFQWNRSPPGEGESTISVLSYNVRAFNFYQWKTNQEEQPLFLQFFRQQKPDILCLQEFFTMDHPDFDNWEQLRELPFFRSGYFAPRVSVTRKRGTQRFGTAILSRYTMLDSGKVRYEAKEIASYADLEVEDHRLRIYNVHLQSFNFRPQELNDLRAEEWDWRSTSRIFQKLRKGYQFRGYQARVLADHVKGCQYPVILVGDFNAPPVSYSYQQLANLEKVRDVFLESGQGIAPTYAGKIPFLRIDYMFADTSIHVRHFAPLKKTRSDHYPLRLEFLWGEPDES